MNKKSIATTATELIGNAGNAAHTAIGMYREGGERLAAAMDARWHAALKQSSKQLTAETRKNATHLHNVLNGYYVKGITMTADGAEVVVDTIVGAAVAGVERVAAFKASQTA